MRAVKSVPTMTPTAGLRNLTIRVANSGIFGQGRHGVGHEAHADHQHREAHQDVADGLVPVTLCRSIIHEYAPPVPAGERSSPA